MRKFSFFLLLLFVVFALAKDPAFDALAFNANGHTRLLERAVHALNDWWELAEVYEFYRGQNSENLDILALNQEPDTDGMSPRILWPNFFSTTTSNQLAYINFLAEANYQPESPAIPEEDFSAIKQCIEQFSTLEITPKEDRAWEATVETSIDLQNRDQRTLAITFPIRKIDQLLLGNKCINLGKTYKDKFLTAKRTVYTANQKVHEYAHNAIMALGANNRESDLDAAFTWLLRVLNYIQQASAPSKSVPLPDDIAENEEIVRTLWCKNVLHRLSFLEFSNFIDNYGPTEVAVPESPHPFDGTFAGVSRDSLVTLAQSTQAMSDQNENWFELMDGFPNLLNDFRFNLICLPERNLLELPDVDDNFAKIADRFLSVDVIYHQARLLYEFHRHYVELSNN